MGLGDRDKEVEAFSTQCADHTFTEAVGFWAARWSLQNTQSHVRDRLIKKRREDAITIMDEKLVMIIRRDGFA
jgi:hypothetical protein